MLMCGSGRRTTCAVWKAVTDGGGEGNCGSVETCKGGANSVVTGRIGTVGTAHGTAATTSGCAKANGSVLI